MVYLYLCIQELKLSPERIRTDVLEKVKVRVLVLLKT